jgi:hypothetical protein
MGLLSLWMSVELLAETDPVEEARKGIIAAYERTFAALGRGDARAALQMDTQGLGEHHGRPEPKNPSGNGAVHPP